MQRLHSGAACDRPETTEIPKHPQIPEVVWQQPPETSTNQCYLKITNKGCNILYLGDFKDESSKQNVATQRNSTNKLRSYHGTPSRKSNRERTSIVL